MTRCADSFVAAPIGAATAASSWKYNVDLAIGSNSTTPVQIRWRFLDPRCPPDHLFVDCQKRRMFERSSGKYRLFICRLTTCLFVDVRHLSFCNLNGLKSLPDRCSHSLRNRRSGGLELLTSNTLQDRLGELFTHGRWCFLATDLSRPVIGSQPARSLRSGEWASAAPSNKGDQKSPTQEPWLLPR